MRVLHVITGLAAGGAERQLAMLLPHLDGHADVVTLTNPGQVATQLRAAGIQVSDLDMRGNRDLTALPRLVRLIRAGRYDIVHTHLYRACLYGRIAARLAGVRHVVATEHSLGDTLIEGRPTSRGVRTLYLATERLGQMTVAVSPTVARRLIDWGVPAERVSVVPNGIEAAEFGYRAHGRERVRRRLGIAPEQAVVGCVSRLEPTKRFDVLLRAVSELPSTMLLLVGEGSERARLAEQATALGIADRVRFTGEATDVPDLLSAMDVYAAPSPQETFGLGVIEALASGLPTVYVACPALQDLPGPPLPTARQVALSPEALRDAVHGALATASHTRREPSPVVTAYDIATMASRLSMVYQQVLAGRRRPASAPADAPGAPATPGATPAPAAVISSAQDVASRNEEGPRGNEDV